MKQKGRSPLPRRRDFAGWFLLLVLGVAVFADTNLNPFGGIIRMLVPGLLLFSALVFPGRKITSSQRRTLAWIFGIGVLSSLVCEVQLLGFLKLVFYVIVVWPLVTNPTSMEFIYIVARKNRGLLLGLSLGGLACLAQVMNIYHLFSNPNKVAAFAMSMIPFCLIFTGWNHKGYRALGYTIIISLIITCVLTHSRAALMGSLTILIVFGFSGTGRPLIRPLFVGVVLVAIIGLLIKASPTLNEYVYKGRDTLMDSRRQEMTNFTLEHFRESPMLGYGFGLSGKIRPENLKTALRNGRLSRLVGEFGNSTLSILAGGGAALLLAFGWFFWIVIRDVSHFIYYAGASDPKTHLMRSLLAGIIGLLVHSQFEGWLLSPLNWITVIFWFYVGMALSLASGLMEEGTVTSFRKRSIQGVRGHSR